MKVCWRHSSLLIASLAACSSTPSVDTQSRSAPLVAVQERTLFPGSSTPGDRFGQAIAADGSTVLVGVPGYAGNLPFRGAIAVFERSDDTATGFPTWEQRTLLTPESNDSVGKHVALAQGVALAAGGRTIHVYLQSADWQQQPSIELEGPVAALSFDGDNLAVLGANETGGFVRVFRREGEDFSSAEDVPLTSGAIEVSVFGDTLAAVSSGEILLYERGPEGTWAQADALADSASSISLGEDRLLVSTTEGADLYERPSAGQPWALVSSLTPETPWLTGQSHPHVSLMGDQALVARPSASFQGLVFQRQGSAWGQELALAASSQSAARVGSAAALTVDDEGAPLVFLEGREPDGAGSVLAFSSAAPDANMVLGDGGNSRWLTEAATFALGGNVDGDRFGTSVALRGTRLAVGASSQVSEDQRNYVSIFELESGGWTRTAELDGAPGDSRFAAAVALSEDQLLASTTSGAWHYEQTDGQWSRVGKLELPVGVGDEGVEITATAIALDNDRAVVGNQVSLDVVGSAYVFSRDNGAWSLETVLTPNAPAGGRFGQRVALEGDVVVVAGTSTSDGPPAFIFARDATGSWSETAVARDPSEGFGGSTFVGIHDGIVAILTTDAARIYERNESGTWEETGRLEVPLATQAFITGFAFQRDRLLVTHGNPTLLSVFQPRFAEWQLEATLPLLATLGPIGAAVVPLSLEGNRVAVGQPLNEERGVDAGAVRLLSLEVTGPECKDELTLVTGQGEVSCAPYMCRDGDCLERCESSADCMPGTQCSAARTCDPIELQPSPKNEQGCGCRAPSQGSSAPILALVVVLPLLRRFSAHRRRRSKSRSCRSRRG